MKTLYRGMMSVVLAVAMTGCSGLKLWEKEKYFRTDLDRDFDPQAVESVGVYVLSEGAPIDGMQPLLDSYDYADAALSMPVMILTLGTIGWSEKRTMAFQITDNVFPKEVETDATFEPDTSNAGPSLELATAIASELATRGYSAKVELGVGHSGEVGVQACLDDARARGHSAAFVVNYSGLKRWRRFRGGYAYRDANRSWREVIDLETFAGYLYLTNAGMFDLASGRRVWSSSYYGIVERAHLANMASDPLITVVPEAIVHNGAENYAQAAPKAAKILFSPEYWPGSFVELPKRAVSKGRKM